MRVSLQWLKEFVNLGELESDPKKLADLLTSRGIEVESIHDQRKGFELVEIAEVVKRDKHPGADRLSVCEVRRASGEILQIVCGASNVRAGIKIALAVPGAALPNGIQIAKSKIRGVESSGMICSEAELGISQESEGIMILPENAPLGENVARYLGRDDVVLELGVTPNRGDCLSHIGVAREIAAATGQELLEKKLAPLPVAQKPRITLKIEDSEGAKQFYGCLVEGVKVGPSPAWVVKRLEAVGQRSINNVVDATNLILFELGQPTHAYDLDRVENSTLRIAKGKSGVRLPLLDGSSVDLTGNELCIWDGTKPVALAGVMGGGNSEVQPQTQNIYLECVEFNPRVVRKSASLHQKRSESSYRFERGVDAGGLNRAITRLAQHIVAVAGGKIVEVSAITRDEKTFCTEISTTGERIRGILGADFSDQKIEEVLTRLGACVDRRSPTAWRITAPSYRNDLKIEADLAEEVGRSLGYDSIPETVPPLTSAPGYDRAASQYDRAERTRDFFERLGFMEAIHYSFTSRAWLSRFGLKSEVPVANPLSEEHETMVPSLLPHLIKSQIDNERHHFGSESLNVRLFELRPTFFKDSVPVSDPKMQTGVKEIWKIAGLMSGLRFPSALKREEQAIDFSDVLGVFESLMDNLGIRGLRILPWTPDAYPDHRDIFHAGISASIVAGKRTVGSLGKLHPRLARELKLRNESWVFEAEWDPIDQLARPLTASAQYRPISEFPPIERDFALVVKQSVKADQITQIALKVGRPLVKNVRVFDVYTGPQIGEGMTSIAVRVIFSEEGRSLQEKEALDCSARILSKWREDLGAELRN